jgi:hypothetical protein
MSRRLASPAPGVHLLALRLRMLRREAAGLVRAEPLTALVFLFLALFGGAYAASWLGTERGCRAVLGALAAVLALVHGARGDARFLAVAGHRPRLVFALEYAVPSLPCAALLAASGCGWKWPAAALALPPALAALPAGGVERLLRRARGGTGVRLRLPARSYEWAAGLRVHGTTLVLVHAAAALLFRYPGVLLACILALSWCASAFHVHGEPWIMLEAYGKGPRGFLAEKLGRSVGLFLVLCLPVSLLLLILHAALWPALAVVLAGAVLVHAGSVLARYAMYRPGRRSGVTGALSVLALTGAMAVPPVGLFLLYRFRAIALHNLEVYLDDLR